MELPPPESETPLDAAPGEEPVTPADVDPFGAGDAPPVEESSEPLGAESPGPIDAAQ